MEELKLIRDLGGGRYLIGIESNDGWVKTITNNVDAIWAAFKDEYGDDCFYESPQQAKEVLINEIIESNEEH
jgi:hypothetical protein